MAATPGVAAHVKQQGFFGGEGGLLWRRQCVWHLPTCQLSGAMHSNQVHAFQMHVLPASQPAILHQPAVPPVPQTLLPV